MTFTDEPMLERRGYCIRTMKDSWTVKRATACAAQYEHANGNGKRL